MSRSMGPALVLLACTVLLGCQAISKNQCAVSATVQPATATADHAQMAPGNQAQFSTNLKITGTCPLPQNVKLGSWSTSDPTDVSITAGDQAPQTAQAVATCLHATTSPVTVSYSGAEYGQSFTSATLTCK